MNQPVPTAGRRRALLVTAAGAAAAAAITSVVVGTSVANAAVSTKSHPMLTTRHTSIGTVLVNSKGRTLYLFTPDSPTKSLCTGACADEWTAFTVKVGTRITVGGGVRSNKITTIKRGHARQVVYAGHPLYTFTDDSRAGETNGEGDDGTWFALTAAGKVVHKHAGSSSSAPSDPDSSSAPSDPGSSDPWG